jgi:V/A-type H+-transporting ATPase subunit D
VDVSSNFKVREPASREYSLMSTSARTDETIMSFEGALEDIIRVAPKLHKLGRLAEEIRKTTRRVNALEQRLLPTLKQQVRYIMGVLDQREREDIFRLKRIKRTKTG